MSVTDLKERHLAATETVNNLRERLKQRRLSLLDTDSECCANPILNSTTIPLLFVIANCSSLDLNLIISLRTY